MKLENGKEIANLTSTAKKSNVPESVGFLFTDKTLISTSLVGSIIFWCMKKDIHRVTLYDPWNLLINYEYELILESQKILSNYNSKNGIKKDEYIKLFILGPLSTYDVVSKVMKEFCFDNKTIHIKNINEKFMKEFIYEIDLLIRIGDIPSLCGYPCWGLRITEIVDIQKIGNKNEISEKEFNKIIISFSTRDRRKGK
uniref:ditrans,polycis-polyprenyl diphosphate synthase [(2E,6E)-farnesyldiphosphate specific] n=1 Tax=Parastrongyloides trichosuri TaxID=131310 RepID=A0A0N4ZHV1_PARTI